MNTLVKSVVCSTFSVELREIEHKYYVIVEDDEGVKYGPPIPDYKLASYMFDSMLLQMEGH